MKLLIALLALTFPLLADMNVLVFAGSTRAESYNKKLAKEAADVAKRLGAKVTLIDLKDYAMPFYDADLEAKGMPKNAKKLRDLMVKSDAIVIATPEYNGSLPAVLKNALDWASRGEDGQPSRDAYKGKSFALLSASPGQGGGARAIAHLQSVIENCGGAVLDTQISVGSAFNAFTDKKLTALQEQIQNELDPLFN
jgi:NAD(P)H-dependent FMN reductase